MLEKKNQYHEFISLRYVAVRFNFLRKEITHLHQLLRDPGNWIKKYL